ncbi:response regulator [Hyunsoonleella pacifica]|uniref:Response regulator transcription factor n=1 Tax=Hyunsoonleella pacifica TaxID=1080224 RepID=A0A4Q9FJM3_9FLAO|nr:response regulator transcription factor [Hyunsoonleella pacifica]TBN13141.1 response regulator transcription factor [Hyunsoonleella pacifica]GGD28507.1 DNA-binding response regulator [Hyunsoonleella pacifica]
MITKIAITDDHQMVLKGIETMLAETKEISIVGLYNSGKQTLDNVQKDNPDILLLDINLPDINGINLCKELKSSNKNLKIIAISNYDDVSFIKRMLSNGADGYLLKNTDKLELLTAFKAVLNGEQYLQRDIEKKLLNLSIGKTSKNPLLVKLTRRENEVLQAIAEELTTQEISKKLFISPKTVETHRMNIMSKLGAKNSVGIIKAAIENGLI